MNKKYHTVNCISVCVFLESAAMPQTESLNWKKAF